MIEADLVRYLRALPVFSTFSPKIHVIQAPKGTIMPYMIVETVAGTKPRLGRKTEEKGSFRISVDCGPGQFVTGRNIIEDAWKALQEYRGVLVDTKDIYITCGVVRGWAGLGETYRYMFDAEYRAIENINSPT
jgi:hypothetical protein